MYSQQDLPGDGIFVNIFVSIVSEQQGVDLVKEIAQQYCRVKLPEQARLLQDSGSQGERPLEANSSITAAEKIRAKTGPQDEGILYFTCII